MIGQGRCSIQENGEAVEAEGHISEIFDCFVQFDDKFGRFFYFLLEHIDKSLRDCKILYVVFVSVVVDKKDIREYGFLSRMVRILYLEKVFDDVQTFLRWQKLCQFGNEGPDYEFMLFFVVFEHLCDHVNQSFNIFCFFLCWLPLCFLLMIIDQIDDGVKGTFFFE